MPVQYFTIFSNWTISSNNLLIPLNEQSQVMNLIHIFDTIISFFWCEISSPLSAFQAFLLTIMQSLPPLLLHLPFPLLDCFHYEAKQLCPIYGVSKQLAPPLVYNITWLCSPLIYTFLQRPYMLCFVQLRTALPLINPPNFELLNGTLILLGWVSRYCWHAIKFIS